MRGPVQVDGHRGWATVEAKVERVVVGEGGQGGGGGECALVEIAGQRIGDRERRRIERRAGEGGVDEAQQQVAVAVGELVGIEAPGLAGGEGLDVAGGAGDVGAAELADAEVVAGGRGDGGGDGGMTGQGAPRSAARKRGGC